MSTRNDYFAYLVMVGLPVCILLIIIDLKIKNDLIREAQKLEVVLYGQGNSELSHRYGNLPSGVLLRNESANHETGGLGNLVSEGKENTSDFWPDAYRGTGDVDSEIQPGSE